MPGGAPVSTEPSPDPKDAPPAGEVTSTSVDEAAAVVQPTRRSVATVRAWLSALAASIGSTMVLLGVLAGAVIGAVWWTGFTPSGAAWVLGMLPGVEVSAPRGALLRDFDADRLVIALPGGRDRIVLDAPGWKGLRIGRAEAVAPLAEGSDESTASVPRLRIGLAELRARRVDIEIAPSDTPKPLEAPASLALPVQVDIDLLRVDELHATPLGETPVRDLRAELHLGAAGGTLHRVDALRLGWDRLQAEGALRIATTLPMAIDARVNLSQSITAVASASAAPAAAASAPTPAQGERAAPTGTASAPPIDLSAWKASLALTGPLATPTLQATVRAPASAGQAPQSLDATIGLRPFANWPLAELNASTQALDLSGLSASAPRTALTGKARVRSVAIDQPVEVHLELRNDAAGLWNESRLPVRTLNADASGRVDDRSTIDVRRFDAEFGTRDRSAGRLDGRGQWTEKRSTLDVTLRDLRPSLLDARAPDMVVGGPVALVGTGLGGGNDKPPAAADKPRVAVQLDLNGALTGGLGQGQVVTAGKTVQLKLSAEIDELRIAIKEVRAGAGNARAAQKDAFASAGNARAAQRDASSSSAGNAHATLAGEATRATLTAPWKVRGKATLIDFDPMVWWPGPADSPWRSGRHRINAEGDLDVLWASSKGSSWTDTRGSARVALADSLIAGVAVEGNATWRGVDREHSQATLALNASGNRIEVQGNFAMPSPTAAAPKRSGTSRLPAAAEPRSATTSGASDAWSVRIDAPTLATMQPLWRLVAGDDPSSVIGGALTSSATVTGRWPELSSRGDLHAEGLRVGSVSVDDATARWNVGTERDAPIDIDVALSQVHASSEAAAKKVVAPQAADSTPANAPAGSAERIGIESAALTIQGTASDHRITLRADSRALPPAWTDALQPAGTAIKPTAATATSEPAPPPGSGARSRLQVEASGGFSDLAATRLAGWRGRVNSLVLKPRREADRVWATASDVDVDAVWGDGPARVTVQPGRAELFGAAVNWQRLYWQAAVPASASPDAPRPQPGEIDARIQFDPLPVAPLLKRVQPDFGWGGDLTIGGHIDLRSAGGFAADIVVERQRGDLSVTDEIGTQALGLTDLRLALNAQQGVWTFSPYINGKSVGLLAGAVVARTRPDVMWPPAETPIEGAISLDVSNLSAWGNWIPTGWRLGGQLKASALLSGELGRPEFVGRLRGQTLSVRNFLEGVNISDGDVEVSLDGKQATIEKFIAKGGTGTLSIEGGMTFGDAPAARLKLQVNQFVLLGRVDRRIVTSGNATIDLSKEAIAVAGAFGIDEGLIDFTRSDAPTLSSDVTVIRSKSSATPLVVETPSEASADAQAAPPSAGARKLALDVKVDLGKELRLRGRGLETGLRGQVRITSPGGRMAVNGTIRTVDGTYAAYGQKLEIDRGQVTFNGPVENPQLNIEATRPETDVRVGVQITGTALNPRIRLFSEPDLSEIDKLSWLVLGRASDGLGSADTALLQTAAIALLSGEGEGITDQLVKAIGLDAVSLKQTDGEVRETVISLGKQLSRRWYVGYERGLNATEGSWQLIYRAARRFTLRAQSGFENSVDLIWTWRWD